jgi:hypothetical protein
VILNRLAGLGTVCSLVVDVCNALLDLDSTLLNIFINDAGVGRTLLATMIVD